MAKNSSSLDASYAAKIRTSKIIRTVICILLCCISVFPFIIMIVNATNNTATISKGITFIPGKYLGTNYKGLMKVAKSLPVNIWTAMLHSACITVPATILQVYFATFTAYGLVTYNFKLKNIAWSFIMAIMMIPAQVSIIGFMQFMIKLNLDNTYWPLILPCIAAPSTVYFMKQYMQGSLSLEIIEAARIDGSGEFRTFNSVVMPLMKPAMATQAIFAFIASWNNLYTPQMILSDTSKATLPMFVSMLRAEQFKQDFGVIYLSLCITIVPILVVYFAFSKYIIAGVALGGVKE